MRPRFDAPAGDPTDDRIATRTIAASFGDTFDRAPTPTDWSYWRGALVGLIARGFAITYKNAGPRCGMLYLWDRLIGWQAGPQDAPPWGPFAQPPNAGPTNGWTTALIDTEPDEPVKLGIVPVPVDDPLVAVLLAMSSEINLLRVGLLALTGGVAEIQAAQQKGLVGNVAAMSLGPFAVPPFTVRLKPPAG